MTDTPQTPAQETPAEALKRVLAAKKAGVGAKAGGFKPGQHPEKAASAHSAAMSKPAFRKASKRG